MKQRDGERNGQLKAEIWKALYDLFRVEHERHLQAAAELDVTPGDLKALMGLVPGRPEPMRALAEMWRCDASTATWIVNRLESRSLVERQVHETDRRVKFVTLSSRGRKLRAKLLDHVYQPPEVLSALSDADLRTLHQLSALLRPDAS